MSKKPWGKKAGSRRPPRPASSLPFLNTWDETPSTEPLSSFDPSLEKAQGWYAHAGGKRDKKFSSDPRDLASLLSYGPSHIPFTYAWTDNRVEQVRHFKFWVYVCVNKIARAVASQYPNVTWVRSSHDEEFERQKVLGPYLRQKALVPLLTHEHLEPVPNTHPLLRLLRDPNEPDTADDLWYETILFLFLTGSAYWWVPRHPSLGIPTAIWVVPSHWMWPIMGTKTLIEGWEIRPVEGNYLRRLLPKEEIVHFKFKNPISKIDGYSPLTGLSQWQDVQEAVARGTWHTYRNGTFPTVAVQFDSSLNDPSDETLRRIEAKFARRYVGQTNSNKPLFLPPGVQVKPLVIKPNEMLFGETEEKMKHNVCAALGVPLELVSLQGDTLAAEQSFYSQTINPLCHWMGTVVTEKLARQYPQDQGELRVWWERKTANDPELENENTKVDLLCGAITPNERRVARGKEPYTGELAEFGNKPLMPVNMEQGTLPGGGDHEAGDNNEIPSNEQPALNDEDYKFFPLRPSLNGTHDSV